MPGGVASCLVGFAFGLIFIVSMTIPSVFVSDLPKQGPERVYSVKRSGRHGLRNEAIAFPTIDHEPIAAERERASALTVRSMVSEEARRPLDTIMPKVIQQRVVVPQKVADVQAKTENTILGETVVVIMAHDRVDSTRACLNALLGLKEVGDLLRVEISGDAPGAWSSLEKAVSEGANRVQAPPIQFVRHAPRSTMKTALASISEHIYQAVDDAFARNIKAQWVLVLEDDLRVAPDFLLFFQIAGNQLVHEESAWCASAWNDNAGDRSADWRPERIERTEYFPGLGWMLGRAVWLQSLRSAWPKQPTTGWDHWLRTASPIRDRTCLFPQVPRVRHATTKASANVRGQEATRLERFAFATNDAILEPPLPVAVYDQELKTQLQTSRRVSTIGKGLANQILVYLARFPEDHQRLAPVFKLWPSEIRAFYKGIIRIRRPHNMTILIADQRVCTWLEPQEKKSLPSNARIIAASQRGLSCNTVCASSQPPGRCQDDLLPFADSCSMLQAHFPCQAGCGHQLGPDLPAFVEDPVQLTNQQCLSSNRAYTSTCTASHRSTKRLCVCLPQRQNSYARQLSRHT